MDIAMSGKQNGSSATTDIAERIRQYLEDVDHLGTADRVPRYRSKRYPYETTQWIAPSSGGPVPDCSEFREVRCRDISTGGFAFLSPQPPDFDEVVVRLGNDAHVIYATARVIHTVPNHGGAGHLVGCQFTGRLLPPDKPST